MKCHSNPYIIFKYVGITVITKPNDILRQKIIYGNTHFLLHFQHVEAATKILTDWIIDNNNLVIYINTAARNRKIVDEVFFILSRERKAISGNLKN